MKAGFGNKNGTQVIRPKQQTKNQQPKQQQKQQQKPKNQKCPKKGGVKIGQSKEDEHKWKCNTCRRLNDIQNYECTFCGDPRFQNQENQGEQDRPLRADERSNSNDKN